MPILETPLGPPSDTPTELQNLTTALLRVARVILLHAEINTPLSELPMAQLRCLNAVARKEGRKMQEVAKELEIKLPAMSQIVERLVQRGMLERRADPTDRRVTRLHLSEVARQFLIETRQVRENHLALATKSLDQDTLVRLTADLTLLADAGEKVHELTHSTSTSASSGVDPVADILAKRARLRRRTPVSVG